MEELQKGDVVILKSDSQTRMTVEAIQGKTAKCVWFVGGGHVQRDIFPILVLKKP